MGFKASKLAAAATQPENPDGLLEVGFSQFSRSGARFAPLPALVKSENDNVVTMVIIMMMATVMKDHFETIRNMMRNQHFSWNLFHDIFQQCLRHTIIIFCRKFLIPIGQLV